MLVDGVYPFVEGLNRPLNFTLLNAAGQATAMHVSMQAAGYLGETYFLSCRDLDLVNYRNVPAHLMSDAVDVESNEAIDTDDLLNDLAQVAYEVIEGAATVGEEADEVAENAAPATS